MTTQEQKKRIDRQMTIEQILSMFPYKAQKLSQEITNAGLHCIGCSAATWETLEAGMYGHGMNDEAIEKLVGRLNQLLDEPINPTTITLTPRARDKYLAILEEENKQGWGMRISEKPAGCSGYSSVLDYSEHPNPDDEIFESLGIQIHIKKQLIAHFIGCEVDYVDGLHGAGFKVSNPNARSSCGCGSSYGY